MSQQELTLSNTVMQDETIPCKARITQEYTIKDYMT